MHAGMWTSSFIEGCHIRLGRLGTAQGDLVERLESSQAFLLKAYWWDCIHLGEGAPFRTHTRLPSACQTIDAGELRWARGYLCVIGIKALCGLAVCPLSPHSVPSLQLSSMDTILPSANRVPLSPSTAHTCPGRHNSTPLTALGSGGHGIHPLKPSDALRHDTHSTAAVRGAVASCPCLTRPGGGRTHT